MQSFLSTDGLTGLFNSENFISLLSVSVSWLSLFCEIFILGTYLKWRKLRPLLSWLHSDLAAFYDQYVEWTASYCTNLRFTERFPLYLHIAFANSLRDFAKILGSVSDGTVLCSLQGFAVNFGGLSTFWWIQTIAWVLYSTIFYPTIWRHDHLHDDNHAIIMERERWMIYTNYGFPLLISMVPLWTGSYGNIGSHCWIRGSTDTDHMLRWLCFYCHLILITVCCLSIYYYIGQKVRDQEFGALFQRIRWYPLCLIFGFGFALLRRSIQIFIDFGVFGQIIHVITTGSFGVFTFVLVGRTRGSFRMSRLSNLSPRHTVEEEEDSNVSAGNDGLRAAIFGLSDGLATNLCLILGVQFALEGEVDLSNAQIITSGVAGLFGGAISMAIGEYVSVSALTDATSAEIAKHRMRLKEQWHSEMGILKEKLTDVLSDNTIDAVIEDLKKAKGTEKGLDRVLSLYCRLVLGVDAEDTEQLAAKSAMYSFGMFSFGAMIPLSPYFWFGRNTACFMAIATSLMIAIILGMAIAYFTHSDQRMAMQRQLLCTVLGVTASILVSKVFNA